MIPLHLPRLTGQSYNDPMTPQDIEQGLLLAAEFLEREGIEGFRAKPYLCQAGISTIGIGSTRYEDGRRVTMMDPPITRERARKMCVEDLRLERLPAVLKWCPQVDTPRRLAGLLSWTYNFSGEKLRASGLRVAVNARNWSAAQAEIKKWNKVTDPHTGQLVVSDGLVNRRALEAEMLA